MQGGQHHREGSATQGTADASKEVKGSMISPEWRGVSAHVWLDNKRSSFEWTFILRNRALQQGFLDSSTQGRRVVVAASDA